MVIVAVWVTCIPLDFSKTPWLYVGEELVPCVSCASGFAAVATRYALGIRHPRVGHEHFHGQLGVITPYCPVNMLYLNLVWIPYLHVGSSHICAVPSALRVCHTFAQHWRLACASPILCRVLDHDIF